MKQVQITKSRPGRIAAALTMVAALAACAGGSRGALDNPNFFTFKSKDGVLTGSYNPIGFNAASIQKQIRSACAGGQIASYSETPDGALVAFTAQCAAGGTASGTASFQIENTGSGTLVEGVSTNAEGDLVFTSDTVPG